MPQLNPETAAKLQRAAREALQVQDASNLSGVLFSFTEHMRTICEAANQLGEGTAWRNQHPVVILFVDKLASLARLQYDPWSKFSPAYDECERLADGRAAKPVASEVMQDIMAVAS